MELLQTLLPLILFVIVVYILYVPSPACAINKAQWHFITSFLKVLSLLGKLLHFCGVCHKAALLQHVTFMLRDHFPDNMNDMFVNVSSIADVRTIICLPLSSNKSGTVVLYIHGGGFVSCVPDVYLEWFHEMVCKLGFTVYAPDYRKAPHHPFPAAFDDCYAVAVNIIADHRRRGHRIIIAGDSAGGHLVAAVSQQLSERYILDLQILIYPVLQFVNFLTHSYSKSIVGVLDKSTCVDMTGLYLLGHTNYSQLMSRNGHVSEVVRRKWNQIIGPVLPSICHRDVVVSEVMEELLLKDTVCPLLTFDLSNQPTTYIITAKYDPLHWDGLQYAARLRNAGVDVRSADYDSFHGAFTLPADGDAMRSDLLDYLTVWSNSRLSPLDSY